MLMIILLFFFMKRTVSIGFYEEHCKLMLFLKEIIYLELSKISSTISLTLFI